MGLVRADHPLFIRWITEDELAANPGLVKSKNVRPPVGTGRIRLVCIGDEASVDSQPCGGTHVSRTSEVGEIHIGKIEKKGRENRRFRIRFGPAPAAETGATNDRPCLRFPDWLQERLGKPGIKIVDGAWYLPSQGRDARAEYDAAHIPGAVFFDQDKVVDPGSSLPHTLPAPEDFARIVGAMGIAETDTIVVHDGPGLFSAPRCRWMFRIMGAGKVYVLEGGLDGWKREGRPLTAEPTRIAPNVFNASFDASRVVTLAEMRKIVDTGSSQIADARSAGRFEGIDPEPRPGLRGGHMPGAKSLPFAELTRDGKLRPGGELKQAMEGTGLDLSKPIVTSCGSGVSAAIISLALETLGHKDNRLYDGAWAEWGSLPDTPVVKGKD
jgi:thiosulfate/3-mercaptopyruvate sulfurtransferase